MISFQTSRTFTKVAVVAYFGVLTACGTGSPSALDSVTPWEPPAGDGESLHEEWQRTVGPYLTDGLWTDRDAYDATHYLMVPLHAAFILDRESWLTDFAVYAERFTTEGLFELTDAPLARLQYLYLWSRFAALAAEHDKLALVPDDLVSILSAEVHAFWLEREAWMWEADPFRGMRERLQWKISTPDVQRSYYRAIIDEEMFLLAIAADLRAFARMSGNIVETSETLDEILGFAYSIFQSEVQHLEGNRWLFQPGILSDHRDYGYAGRAEETPGMSPAPVPGIASDISHSHRYPLWLRSFAAAYEPGSELRAYYNELRLGFEEQFFAEVLVPPTAEFDAYRTTNFMDGQNGVYRWEYETQGEGEGYGPFELSGTLLLGWWSFLGTERSCGIYGEMTERFPLDEKEITLYVGPNTTRDRHPLVSDPESYENGFRELIVRLAARLCETTPEAAG